MKRMLSAAVVTAVLPVLLLVLVKGPVAAHDDDHAHAGAIADGERFGTVSFPVSCTPDAAHKFERAVAILHSFWYEQAAQAFTDVARSDPKCAMAYWGIAMSLYQQLWYPHDVDAQKGLEAARTATSLGAQTQRERDYIAAIELYYTNSDTLNWQTRAMAYSKAMEALSQRYPQDREAAIFYALSLDATALPTDKTYGNQRTAGALLEQIFSQQPDHPGVAHYIIHSYDVPGLAQQALPAARKYATIAPSAPHALHMPSHIFTRLGMWHDVITSNVSAAKAGMDYSANAFPGAVFTDTLHSMDYLEYAYLQIGDEGNARRIRDEMAGIKRAQPSNAIAGFAFTAVPARYALERGDWTAAAALPLYPADFPWERFPWTRATIDFAHAIGFARSGNPGAASEALKNLESARDTLLAKKEDYWAGQVEIQRLEAAAWIAQSRSQHSDALQLLRSAAALEDSTEKAPVTPGAVVPARELLGDLLLAVNQPAQAFAEYKASLQSAPNRFHGVLGAARAAQLSGDVATARIFYANLLTLAAGADGMAPELAEAHLAVDAAR